MYINSCCLLVLSITSFKVYITFSHCVNMELARTSTKPCVAIVNYNFDI